jgi:hypothetical protein
MSQQVVISYQTNTTNNAEIAVSNTGGTYPARVKILSTGVNFRPQGTPNDVTLESSDVSKLKSG